MMTNGIGLHAEIPATRRAHVCESPATRAGVVQHQHAHLAEEVQRLTARVAELEAENARLRAGHRYAEQHPED